MSMAAAPSVAAAATMPPGLQCRTCRRAPQDGHAVPVETMVDYGKSVADMIYELTDILVTVDRYLPQVVCPDCVADLRSAYNFRQRCIDSNDAFVSEWSTGATSAAADSNMMLVLKMEACDTEVMEFEKEPAGDEQECFNVLPEAAPDRASTTNREKRVVKAGSKRPGYAKTAMLYIVEHNNRHYCNIDPHSKCDYCQKTRCVGNFVRHFRSLHPEAAERKGLVPGVLPTEEGSPDKMENREQGSVAPEKGAVKANWRTPSLQPAKVARKFIKGTDGNMFRCAIDESNFCNFSRPSKDIPTFIRHFRAAHPKAAAANNLYSRLGVREVPQQRVSTQEKMDQKAKSKPLAVSNEFKSFSTVKRPPKIWVSRHVNHQNGKFYCAIDGASNCCYAQRKFVSGNFLRHFRTQHPLEAIAEDLVHDEVRFTRRVRKAIVKKPTVSSDSTQILEACIKLMAWHNFPVQCFGWAGLRSLLQPLTKPLKLEIDAASMVEYVHRSAEHLVHIMQQQMERSMVSIQIDCVFHDGTHFLVVSANYEYNLEVLTRVLGLIRMTEATPASELKVKLSELLAKYNVSDHQVMAIVLGNVGSALGTHKKLQKMFADSLTEPMFEYGEPEKESALMETLAAALEDTFGVVTSVVSTILLVLNDIVPNTDPTIQRIERFLQDLRSPQYEDYFDRNKAPYPPLWRSQRWLSKFKSIRSLIKQEPLLDTLAQHCPELALDGTDWQFLHEYHEACLPLYRLIKNLERSGAHVTFSAFYMRCLLVAKEVRGGTGNRFSKPLSDSLGKRLIVLRESRVLRAALYLDPRFLHFKSSVLTLEQERDAQVSILTKIA